MVFPAPASRHNDSTSDTTKRRKEKQVHAVMDPLSAAGD